MLHHTFYSDLPAFRHIRSGDRPRRNSGRLDVVPVAIQVTNVVNNPPVIAPGSRNTCGTYLYAYSSFTLYVLQVCLMIVSVWVVTVKTKQLALLQSNPVTWHPVCFEVGNGGRTCICVSGHRSGRPSVRPAISPSRNSETFLTTKNSQK